jgi:chemotaxis protein methyltransferase WspC
LDFQRAELETAHRLADAGQLKEAARVCEAHLRKNSASAPAYYLLGLLRDADGDASAIECYRKALYLEPDHYETLLQMAQLSQRSGNSERARAFKSRAQRVKAGT